MEDRQTVLFLLLLLLTLASTSNGIGEVNNNCSHKNKNKTENRDARRKLFVFGDSYVDTGNFDRNHGSWLRPYGYTFPGKPSGRFSDGCVLTDYIASYLGIKTPLAYKMRKHASKTQLQRGMNFANGGSGVFKAYNAPNNITAQIDRLKELIDDEVYTKRDLRSSVALVTVSGNDFRYYENKLHGTFQGLPSYTKKVISQLVKDLNEIKKLGVKKVAVTSSPPLGCFPEVIGPNPTYLNCNRTVNTGCLFHNKLLDHAVNKLNKHSFSDKQPAFVVLDLYYAFLSVIDQLWKHKEGKVEHMNPLKQCWRGEKVVNGKKEFLICEHPELAFFWDKVHPTQSAWHSVYLTLIKHSHLHRLID